LKVLKYILYPFAFLYGIIATVRNVLFDIGILRSHRFPLFVISIGNLSVGGTGKSPHAEYIARLLEKLSFPFDKMAILSRGYGRRSKGFSLVTTLSTADEVGDEPLQLKRKLNGVSVAVHEKRVDGINKLLELSSQLKAVILDDAFQHRYVKRDLSILLTNYNAPFYNDCMLPAGRLREPRRGYKRAQFIIVTSTPVNITTIEKKLILEKIKPKHKQKVFFSSIVYQSLCPVFNVDTPISGIDKSCSVLLLTGIANAHSLYSYLTEKTRDVIHIPFPDHYAFKISDITKVIKSFNAITNPNKIIVTTEKDAMRLQSDHLLKEFGTAPICYLPIQVKVHEEKEFKDALLTSLTH
jgi:tetraacyldisaccharide 4'-kinase